MVADVEDEFVEVMEEAIGGFGKGIEGSAG